MLRYPCVLLLCAIAGCAVGPNYHPPEVAVEQAYAPLPPGVTNSVNSADPANLAQWWTSLGDGNLDALVRQAIHANYDIRLAEVRVREARARRGIVAAEQFPAVDAGALFSHSRLSQNAWPYNAFAIPGFPWEASLYQVGFDASWELDVFGGVRRGVEAADADLAASIEGRRAVLVVMIAEVARNYVELRSLQQQYEIASRNLQAQQQTLDLTNEQARKGVATQLDVSRARAQVASTESMLPQFRNLQWQTMHRLAVLTGQQPDALVKQLSVVKPVPLPPAGVSTGVPAELLRRRPDIRQRERELASATARIGMAQADLYPRFKLFGSFDLQAQDIDKLFRWDSRSFSVGPAVQWRVFDAGALRSIVKVRNAQQEQALIQYEYTVQQALEEVHDALASFVTQQDRERSLEAAVKANEEAAELSASLYRNGMTDFTSVLDAERQLYRSQEDLVQSQTTVTTSVIALYKALGGGWQTEEDTSVATPATQPSPQKNPPQAARVGASQPSSQNSEHSLTSKDNP